MPCKIAISSDYDSGDLTLKSPKMIVNRDFEQSMLLNKSSKPDKKNSNSEVLWLGHPYTTATYPLFYIVTSQTRHSVKDVMFTTRIAKDSL